MAASIARAIQDDETSIAKMAGEESRAARDCEIAFRLGGQPSQVNPQTQPPIVHVNSLTKHSIINATTTTSEEKMIDPHRKPSKENGEKERARPRLYIDGHMSQTTRCIHAPHV